jgi:predicted nuclease of restriction endonuclease-like (RecB) superfamily
MSINIDKQLFSNLVQIIEQGKKQVAVKVNSTVILTYWQIGKTINEHILNNSRAAYGKEIVATVATQLIEKFGSSFAEGNLRRMIQFSDLFADFEIVVPLARQLSWSHFLILLPLKTNESRIFYAQKAIEGTWGKRELRHQIERKAFERSEIANTQLASFPQEFSDTTGIFKDPYFLDFLGLKDGYLEKDIETAILKELQNFILELGEGFSFIARQKRIIVDGRDFSIDLLFFNRKLKRLVAIDLKLGEFEAGHKGKMELYLNWLNRYEKQDGENNPIGLILCAAASREQVELLEMHKDGIMVAEYWTELPPKNMLEQKLHSLLKEAKERIETRKMLEERD